VTDETRKRRYEFYTVKKHLHELVQFKKCANCHAETDLHLHHIVPLSNGGTNNPTNLVFLCTDCHSKVHSAKIARSELIKLGKERAKENDPEWREGRPPKFTKKQIEHALQLLETHSYKQVEELTGISKSTLIRAKRKREQSAQ
jgi:5-methylcytosine-specific restriction endonuclease McrA